MATVDAYIAINMNNFDPGPNLEVVYADSQWISFENYSSTYAEDYYGSFFYDFFGDLTGGTIREMYSWERDSIFWDWELRVAITGLVADVDTVAELSEDDEFEALRAYLFRSADTMLGSNFTDQINGYAGSDLIYGYAGNDLLKGMAGADSLVGGAGRDRLMGGNGSDRLNGGAGNDTFLMQSALDPGNVDTIVGFTSGSDTISLDDDIFLRLNTGSRHVLPRSQYKENTTGRATESDDRIIYNTSTGELFYDADGTGPLAAKKFAVLAGDPALDYDDFIVTT